MEQLLTANVANNLYWFGRYLERIEATLIEVVIAFDAVIDTDKEKGKDFYKKLDIDIEYSTAKEFLKAGICGNHEANLSLLMSYVRENAITCRSVMDTEAFGSVIELSTLLKHSCNNTFDLDYEFIDKIQSLISEVWGELTRKQHRNTSDYFIRLGKLVEKVDFHLRLGEDKEFSLVIMEEIDKIVTRLAPASKFVPHDKHESHETIMNSINAKINKIIVED